MQFNFYRYRECFSNQTHFPWHPDSWCLDVLRYGSRDLSTLRHPAKTEAQAHYPMFHISPSTPAVCLTDVPLTMLCLWTEIIHGPSKYKRVQHKSFTAPWSWLVIFSLVATFIGSKVHSAPLRLCGKSPQSQFLFSHFLNSEAFTGVLTKSETKWEASVTNVSTSESKRWYLHPCADGLLVERSDGFQCRAERMMLSKEWQSVVEQPVAAGETLLIKAAPGSGKSTLLREWCRGRPDNNILLVAFNKAVSEQLDVNFRRGVLFVEFWFDVHFSFFFFFGITRGGIKDKKQRRKEKGMKGRKEKGRDTSNEAWKTANMAERSKPRSPIEHIFPCEVKTLDLKNHVPLKIMYYCTLWYYEHLVLPFLDPRTKTLRN